MYNTLNNTLKVPEMPTRSTYGIIYTDPPWAMEKGNRRKCRPNQGKALDYPTLTLSEIADLHKPFLSMTEARHNVFMWTTEKFLFDCEKMMADLGYRRHTRFIWDKTKGIAPAMTVRYTHEFLIWFFKEGKMLMPHTATRGKFTTVFREKSLKHSQKPVCAYEMLEAMFPDAK